MPTDFSNYSDMNSCQVFKTIERKSGERQKSRILNLEITWVEMSVLAHNVNASIWEAEQVDLSQLQVSQGYTVRPCLKKKKIIWMEKCQVETQSRLVNHTSRFSM